MASALINIDVPDIAAAEAFYTEAFGLTVGRRFGADFVELLGWPIPIYLLRAAAGTAGAATDPRRYTRHWTPIHPDVVVDDMNTALTRALAAGATLEHAPRLCPYGQLAVLADPFGHGFCLIEFNPAGYDALLP